MIKLANNLYKLFLKQAQNPPFRDFNRGNERGNEFSTWLKNIEPPQPQNSSPLVQSANQIAAINQHLNLAAADPSGMIRERAVDIPPAVLAARPLLPSRSPREIFESSYGNNAELVERMRAAAAAYQTTHPDAVNFGTPQYGVNEWNRQIPVEYKISDPSTQASYNSKLDSFAAYNRFAQQNVFGVPTVGGVNPGQIEYLVGPNGGLQGKIVNNNNNREPLERLNGILRGDTGQLASVPAVGVHEATHAMQTNRPINGEKWDLNRNTPAPKSRYDVVQAVTDSEKARRGISWPQNLLNDQRGISYGESTSELPAHISEMKQIYYQATGKEPILDSAEKRQEFLRWWGQNGDLPQPRYKPIIDKLKNVYTPEEQEYLLRSVVSNITAPPGHYT